MNRMKNILETKMQGQDGLEDVTASRAIQLM